jgi:Protein of unknown function (DUF3631)
MPDAAYNRVADNWRPLFAIAELAGGDWPKRCENGFFKVTSKDDDDSSSIGIMLLSDIQLIFTEYTDQRIFSKDLLERGYEYDAWIKSNEELGSLLNAGHRYNGAALRCEGDGNKVRRARAEAEANLRASPDYPNALVMLGLMDAGLGRKEGAIREGRRAAELAPVSKEALVGSAIVEILSVIYAWTGEKDRAFEQLALSARIPAGVTYGELKLHPYWDPLRGDPRFEKIVASLAPKAADK